MIKHLERSVADIIFHLSEKSFKIWIIIISIQALQLMETGAYLISLHNPQNQLLFVMRKIFGIVTLRPVQQQFYYCSVFFQIICRIYYYVDFLYLLLLISQLINGKPRVSPFLNYCEIWCPVIITISIQSLNVNTNIIFVFLSIFAAISSTLLWALRLIILKQDFVSRNSKFSSFKSLARMALFCFQSVLLYFPIAQLNNIIFMSVSLGTLCIAFILSMTIFENVDEQLEYLHYLKCTCAFTFYLIGLIAYFMPSANYLILFSIPLFFLFQKLGILKMLFEFKYNFLLDRVTKTLKDEDLVILLQIICSIQSQKFYESKLLKGRSEHLWTFKHIQFKFHLRAKSVCANLAIKQAKQFGQNNFLINILKQQPFYVIEQYMSKKISSKSKLLYFVLTSQCIKRMLLIKGLSIHSSIIGEMNFNERVMKKVLKYKIQHMSNVKDKIGSIYQISQGLCCLKTSIIKSTIQEIIQQHNFFEQFLKQMIQLSLILDKLFTKLIIKVIDVDKIVKIIQKQSQIKEKLNKMIEKSKSIIDKQLIVLFYIYYHHFCSQKFSSFLTLGQYFLLYNKIVLKRTKQYMVTLVSASQYNRGTILHSNHQMVEFFNLDYQYIKQGIYHIQDFLPRPLALIHNDLIARCLQTGLSTIIGATKTFYVVKGNTCYPIQFQVKFQPYLQGMNFSCQLRLLSDDCFILYDKHNEILALSQTSQWTLAKKYHTSKFMSDIFGTNKPFRKASQSQLSLNAPHSIKSVGFSKKYDILKIDTYKTKDFEIGICYFQKTNMTQSRIAISEDKVGLSSGKQSTNSSVKLFKQNNQLLLNELKISKISNHFDIVSTFFRVLLGYGLTLIVLTSVFYKIIEQCIQKGALISQFQSTVFYVPVRPMVLGIDRAFNFYRAMYSGYIPFDIKINNTVTLIDFINQEYKQQLKRLYVLKTQMIIQSQFLPAYYLKYLTSNTLTQNLRSGGSVPMPFPSFLAYTFDRKVMSRHNTPNQWLVDDPAHAHLMNFTLLQFQQKLLRPIIRSQIQQNAYQNRQIMIFLACVLFLSTSGIIGIFIMVNKLIQVKDKYIKLLGQLPNKYMKQKFEANRQISTLFQIIIKSSLSSLSISDSNQVVHFKYGSNKSSFDKNIMNIGDKKQSNFEITQKSTTSSRKSFKDGKYKCKQYGIIVVSIILFIPIITMLTTGYVKTTTSALNAFGYFQQFVQLDVINAQSVTLLLNLNIMAVSRNTNNVTMVAPKDQFPRSCNAIVNRTMEEKLKNFYPNISHNKKSEKQIQDFLYLNQCNFSDPLCSTILSGSFTRGIPSGLLAYLTLAIKLHKQNYGYTGVYSQDQLQELLDLFRFYVHYLRQSMQMIQFVLSKVKQILQFGKFQCQLLLELTLILQLILIIFLVCQILYQKRKIHQIKKQTLTILPVDILIENINFNFQISNIS